MGAAATPPNLSDLPPPDRHGLIPITHEVPLSRRRYLLDRHNQYKGRIAWFSLELSATIDGRREVIARIDSNRGTIHMSTFARGGVEEVEVIDRIPADSPSDFLDNAYLAAYDHLVSGADQLIKAWHGERPVAFDDLGTIPRQ